MRGLKNEIIKPTYDMKKLILLLFIPLVFACSDERSQSIDEKISGRYFIYQGFLGETAINKPMLNGQTLHNVWQFFDEESCFNFTGSVAYTVNSITDEVISLTVGDYYVSYRLLTENPLTLAYQYGGGQVVMQEVSLSELQDLQQSKADGCCSSNCLLD